MDVSKMAWVVVGLDRWMWKKIEMVADKRSYLKARWKATSHERKLNLI